MKRIYKKEEDKRSYEFSFITQKGLLKELEKAGMRIEKRTLLRLEDKGFFKSKRTPSGWRVYSKLDVKVIVRIIKKLYNVDQY